MKGDNLRNLLEHLSTIMLAGMPAKVAAVRALRPTETLPDIAAIYTNEEDYNLVKLTPALLLMSQDGPTVLKAMSDAYLWEYQVDIVSFDVPNMDDGLPGLWNRLYAYQGCATDLLLSDYGYAAGYWDEARPLEAVDPQRLVYERFGEVGRIAGYRFGFQVPLSYASS